MQRIFIVLMCTYHIHYILTRVYDACAMHPSPFFYIAIDKLTIVVGEQLLLFLLLSVNTYKPERAHMPSCE